jgi:hypothetical protein
MKRWIFALTPAALAGCSVSPSPLLTIPEGHPASAALLESPYSPPPNPFQQEVPPATPPAPKEEKREHSHHEHGQAGEAAPKKSYPLEACVVSGEKLGAMGNPVVLEYGGREVRLCCPACIDKFKREPAKYLKSLDEAEKKRNPADEKKKPEHEGHS